MEIILAAQFTATDDGQVIQAPLIDFSLGIFEDKAQIAIVLPYVRADLDGAPTANKPGNAEIGVKYRFVNTDRWQLSFAPYYIFGVSDSAAQNGIGSANNTLALPVNAEYQINDRWRFNGEVTRFSVDDADDSWAWGVALAYAAREDTELLVELAGAADSSFDDHALDLRIGFDRTVSERFHVLASIASGLREPAGAASLDADIFVGFQWFL